MKKLFFMLCFILLSSCSKKLYYAYENKEDGSYCTFEVNKNEILYRAVSIENYIINSYPTKEYVYIACNNSIPYSEEPKIGFGALLLYSKTQELPMIMQSTQEPLEFLNDYLFYKNEGNDSLKLIKDEKLMKNEEFFKKHDLFWFPPYLERVKKIDYSKFNLDYNKKFLKTLNPKYK